MSFRKRKLKRSNEVRFKAPFSMRVCEARLSAKTERSTNWFHWATNVYISRVNPDTRMFLLTHRAAEVYGRLDVLDANGTLVNAKANINWLVWAGATLQNAVICIVGSVLLFVLAWIIALLMVPDLWLLIGGAAEISRHHPLLAPAVFLLYHIWQARHERNQLLRSVERLLTDAITDIPNFDAIAAETDGELVPAPPMKPLAPRETGLEELLKPKRESGILGDMRRNKL